MAKTNVVHGARVLFKKDGELIGLGQQATITENTPLAPVDPVGTPYTYEHIRTAYDADITLTIYRPTDGTLVQLGLYPSASTGLEILEAEDVTFEVYDITDDLVLERCAGLKIERVSRSYRKGELTLYECSGKCQVVTTEADN